jgi:hypothetical protein
MTKMVKLHFKVAKQHFAKKLIIKDSQYSMNIKPTVIKI